MNPIIIDFFEKQTCANIACVTSEGKPYSFSCFFAFHAEEAVLYFKSSGQTYHAQVIAQNPYVSGTVLPDSLQKINIRGIQFEGFLIDQRHPKAIKGRNRYIIKYPFSITIPGEIWTIQLTKIKLSDSTLGFGKKLIWESAEAEAMADKV